PPSPTPFHQSTPLPFSLLTLISLSPLATLLPLHHRRPTSSPLLRRHHLLPSPTPPPPPPPPNLAADILRRHVILQYLSLPDLRRLPSTGKLFTTLFQNYWQSCHYLLANFNITTTTNSIIIHSSTSNATVLSKNSNKTKVGQVLHCLFLLMMLFRSYLVL
ncbi:hypothetical protein Leryth_013929, partial [Lithospermum erythrorhizon]